MYLLNAQKWFHMRLVVVATCTSLMTFACGSEVELEPIAESTAQALRIPGKTIALHGAYRIGGLESSSWHRFYMKGRQNEDGLHFKKHILLDRGGSSLNIEYRYRDLSMGYMHPSLQGSVSVYNAREGSLRVEVDAEVRLGQTYGPGYAMTVARLELTSGEDGGVLESLGRSALMQVDFSQDIHFDLFKAPYLIIAEGPGEIYDWDFKVGPYPEEEFLFEKVDRIKLSHAFEQGADTENEMQSWNWLTLFSSP